MFGVVDALVPVETDNLRRFSFKFLRDYFRNMEPRYTRTLLNYPIVEFTPGSIILRKGRSIADAYSVINGTVERIRSEDDVHNVISPGGLIGEYSGRHGKPSASTYRTVSYVRALKLTQDSCLGFIRQNGLEDEIKRLLKYREAVEQTWLFGETNASPAQNKIAKLMKMREYHQAGIPLEDVPADSNFIVDSGEIERVFDREVIETLGRKSVFGEKQVLLGRPTEFEFRTAGLCRIYEVPGTALVGIPIVMWKRL